MPNITTTELKKTHGVAAESIPLEFIGTQEMLALVNDAAKLVQSQGESCFDAFRKEGSPWRERETYIFVLDPKGRMLVHPDPELEGKDTLQLKDVNGRPIIRGFIDAVTALPEKPEGWYHYQWPVPDGILPRWKSSYVRLVHAPNGQNFIIGSGVYNDRMERAFVVDMVKEAVGQIEKLGVDAFPLFHDKAGRFMAKDSYIFVVDQGGVELVSPAFPSHEGRNVLDVKDTDKKYVFREMLAVARTRGSGWVNYMWPRPGESISTQKSSYVARARLKDDWVMVGSGVYLADALKSAESEYQIGAPDIIWLVREGAQLLEKKGTSAYPELRKKGSKWFDEDHYFFVWTMDGVRRFHAADPSLEGSSGTDAVDVLGRQYGKMMIEIAASSIGEGWVHYMYPHPGQIFPAWKSVFVKRITFPDGGAHFVGCGTYHLQMDAALIEDLVFRASSLVRKKGEEAFDELRDKQGQFYFMDTYVFVDSAEGIELVNPAFPSLQGQRVIDLKDADGKAAVRSYIQAALAKGSQWLEYKWYKPGTNELWPKKVLVHKVEHNQKTFIVGSGFYSTTKEG